MVLKRFKVFWPIFALILIVLSGCFKGSAEPDVFAMDSYEGDLSIHFFHLEDYDKMGESILVKTPEGKTILIDAGMPEAGPIVDEYLDDLGVGKLDYVMPSHPHVDHRSEERRVGKARRASCE